MRLRDWICCEGPERERLLRDARRIAGHLPPSQPGSLVALAFGRDRRAFAASLVACWLRGHGAAVAENALRERILGVLAHPDVVDLLHDTDSGRTLQVPRLLDDPARAPSDDSWEEADALPAPLLTVHVQTEDGHLRWCRWGPQEAAAASEAAASAASERAAAPATPGLLSSLFVDTLGWLRGARPLEPSAGRPVGVEVAGAPTVRTQHAARVAALRAAAGVQDAAVVHDRAGRPLFAVAGPGAAAAAAAHDDVRAVEAVPRDPNGQPLRAELCLLFGLGRDGQPVTRALRWRALAAGPDEASWRTELPPDYVFYEGHFDGYPVLAGGAQLHELVLPRLRASAGALPALEQLDGVKFLARFVPGETIDLILRRLPDAHKVTFEVRRGETRCTTGRLQFAAEVPALDGSEQA